MKEKDGQEVRPEVKILLIEDCDKDTHLFRLAAEEAEKRTGCRFRITAVTTLSQAAEVFRSDLNDAVFFDLTLPDSAPLETIATLAAIAANFGRPMSSLSHSTPITSLKPKKPQWMSSSKESASLEPTKNTA